MPTEDTTQGYPMTVARLIEELEKFDGDDRVDVWAFVGPGSPSAAVGQRVRLERRQTGRVVIAADYDGGDVDRARSDRPMRSRWVRGIEAT